jgi:hypothetical protein
MFRSACQSGAGASLGHVAQELFEWEVEDDASLLAAACSLKNESHLKRSRTKKPRAFSSYKIIAFSSIAEANKICKDTTEAVVHKLTREEVNAGTKWGNPIKAVTKNNKTRSELLKGVIQSRSFKAAKVQASQATSKYKGVRPSVKGTVKAKFYRDAVSSMERRKIAAKIQESTASRMLKSRRSAIRRAFNQTGKTIDKLSKVAGALERSGVHERNAAAAGTKFYQGASKSGFSQIKENVSSPIKRRRGGDVSSIKKAAETVGAVEKNPTRFGKQMGPLMSTVSRSRFNQAIENEASKNMGRLIKGVEGRLGNSHKTMVKKTVSSLRGQKISQSKQNSANPLKPSKIVNKAEQKLLSKIFSKGAFKSAAIFGAVGGVIGGDISSAIEGAVVGAAAHVFPVVGTALDLALIGSVAKAAIDVSERVAKRMNITATYASATVDRFLGGLTESAPYIDTQGKSIWQARYK